MPILRTARQARRRPDAAALFEPLDPRVLMSGTPIDIEGVYDASLDQPRQYALLRRTSTGDPLTATDPLFGDQTFTVEVFYDTGASGVLISKETADAMGVGRSTYNGEPVQFEDVGVNGSDFFDVSEPLYTALAPYGVDRDLDNPDTFESVYTQQFGPLRMQVAQNEVDPFLGTPLDVWGMPAMAGKVVVMDARPTNSDNDLGVMRTYTYNPGTPYNAAADTNDPGIPHTNFHLKLSYASLDRFTGVTPAGAPGPTLNHNPFIGPNPVRSIDPTLPPDNTPGITVTRGSKSVTGSWLLDTGAAASMISEHAAAALGVHYADPDPNPDPSQPPPPPRLVDDNGNDIPDQFTLDIGGIGGSSTAAGFYLDSLVLPTQEGQPIRYLRAPVLVHDVSTADPKTGQSLTLDGVFGMNFLVASMDVNGIDFGDVHAGAYDWITFDEPHGILGLNIPGAGPVTPQVVGRHVFYNHTSFDGYNPAANALDDNAIATDKQALLPGQTATFTNYTGAANGITGIMFDVSNLANAAGVGADDVTIRVGTTATPASWATGPAPAVTVRPGAGEGGSDRVELTWADGKIANEWVQVTVKADADTGLAEPDVFYFGNLVGDTGDQTAAAVVNSIDLARTRQKMDQTAGASSPFDVRRDGRINSLDIAAVRGNMFQSLRLITAPATTTVAAASASAPTQFAGDVIFRPALAPDRRRAWADDAPDLLGRVA